MKKIDCIYRIGESLTSAYLRMKYELHFEGQLPKQGAYVLLPKHQDMLDILVEGHFVYRTTHRTANYVMRGFPQPFDLLFQILGGIPIARPKDLRKGTNREKAHELNEKAKQRVLACLSNGEPVIIHPEGTRHYRKMGDIKIKPKSILATIIETTQTPLIPLGIEYTSGAIIARTGEQFYTNNTQQLEEKLKKELAALSNLH